jgi:hypothetical protein
MIFLRSLALAAWMAGLYRSIFYPDWGPLAGRGWLWQPPAMANALDPVHMLVDLALWNVGWLLAAWAFTLGLQLCPVTPKKI